MDYRFFLGTGAEPQPDVVVVTADEGYLGLSRKTQLKMRWARFHDYDFVFSGFQDTYARPERLRSCAKYEYYGNIYVHPDFGRYCQGGVGYLVGRKAISALCDDTTVPHETYTEDVWTGYVLSKAGIEPTGTGLFVGTGLNWSESKEIPECYRGPKRNNDIVTCHLSYYQADGKFRPQDMYDMHDRWLRS
jgi:hypothetical protein